MDLRSTKDFKSKTCKFNSSEISPTRCNNCCILLDLFHYYKARCSEPQILNCKFKMKPELVKRQLDSRFTNLSSNEGSYVYSNNQNDSQMCKIFHQNIRGLSHKIDELMLSLSEINPQVLCITEHHLNSNEINSMDYGQYTLGARYCRRLFNQGGAAIFVPSNIDSEVVELGSFCREKDLEICATKIQLTLTSLLILCVYRSPSDFLYFLTQFFFFNFFIYVQLIHTALGDNPTGYRTCRDNKCKANKSSIILHSPYDI